MGAGSVLGGQTGGSTSGALDSWVCGPSWCGCGGRGGSGGQPLGEEQGRHGGGVLVELPSPIITASEIEELGWSKEVWVEESPERLGVAELGSFELEEIVDMLLWFVTAPSGVFVKLVADAVVEEVTIANATVATELTVWAK